MYELIKVTLYENRCPSYSTFGFFLRLSKTSLLALMST